MSFIIIHEKEIDYQSGSKNQLWVSVLFIDNTYYLEVSTTYECVGRILLRNEIFALEIFQRIIKRLKQFNDIYSACQVLEKAYQMLSAEEMLFVVMVSYVNFNITEIIELHHFFEYSTTPIYEYYIYTEEAYANKIDVFFHNKERSIGYWQTPRQGDNFTFHFNKNYIK